MHTFRHLEIEGATAIRVHARPRRAKFTPSLKTTRPGSEQTTDPWLDRLGPNRTTRVRFKSGPAKTIEIQDDWAHVPSTDEILGEDWVGETHVD